MDSVTRLLWWLLSSSAGAPRRVEILRALRAQPRNARQLATALSIDYTTVRHHLKVLQANRLIDSSGEHYGQVYSVAPVLEARWVEVEQIGGRRAHAAAGGRDGR